MLSQVHVAWLERERASAAFERAQELSQLQNAIQEQTENAARSNAETQLELVRARVETLLATRARDLSYAELVNAQNTVYQAAGIDPLPQSVADLSIAGLAREIADTNRLIERGHIEVPRLQGMALEPASGTPVAQAAVVQPVAALPALRTVTGQRWENLGAITGGAAAEPHAKAH